MSTDPGTDLEITPLTRASFDAVPAPPDRPAGAGAGPDRPPGPRRVRLRPGGRRLSWAFSGFPG